jgi:hypothetical protein
VRCYTKDGKRWSFVGTITGSVRTAEDENTTETTSVSVTLVFDTKTGSIELTVAVHLVERCTSAVSRPVTKARVAPALEARI